MQFKWCLNFWVAAILLGFSLISAPVNAQLSGTAVRQGVIIPEYLLGMAFNVAQEIDEVRYREVWSEASREVRVHISDDEFVKGVTALRRGYVAPSKRLWTRLDVQMLTLQPEKKIPAGLYANCIFETQFGELIRREILSFRLDEDQKWRLAGYRMP